MEGGGLRLIFRCESATSASGVRAENLKMNYPSPFDFVLIATLLPGHLQSNNIFHLNQVIQIIAFDLSDDELLDGQRSIGLVSAAARP